MRWWIAAATAAVIASAMFYAAYWHWRNHAFDAMILDAAQEHDLPPALLRAVIRR